MEFSADLIELGGGEVESEVFQSNNLNLPIMDTPYEDWVKKWR